MAREQVLENTLTFLKRVIRNYNNSKHVYLHTKIIKKHIHTHVYLHILKMLKTLYFIHLETTGKIKLILKTVLATKLD